MSLSLLCWTLILAFIPCELGERVRNAMSEINDSINQFYWYLFPMKVQKMLPIILLSVQQPVEIQCFGSITCTRIQKGKLSGKEANIFTHCTNN